MLINPADWFCLADRPMAAWLCGLSSMSLTTLSEYLIYMANRLMIICKTTRITYGADRLMNLYRVTRGLYLDRLTDGPL